MLSEIASGLWGADHDLRLPGGALFPCRMTVLRLRDGSLLLCSPVPIDDELAREIARHGEVRHIVAPNCMHHFWVSHAAERYPAARVYVAPGLPDKRRDLPPHEVLSGGTPAPLRDDLATVLVRGAPRMNEVVLVHGATRTAIVTDLVFNIREHANWQAGLLMRLTGVRGKVAQSRFWRFLTRDRAAAGQSVSELLDHDFDRVVMAHGQVIEQDGRAAVASAARWMLGTRARAA